MDYKKVIKNQELRFKILDFFRFIPDKMMIALQYKIKLGRRLNINEPKRFTEKLQWYKLNYRTDLMTQAADKYHVRKYIESKNLSHTLNKLYGVYSDPEELNLDKLPEKFVIKTTNGSGTNYFCTNKKNFDMEQVKANLSHWLNRNIYASGREWSYKNIKPLIIVEELLIDEENPYNGINDYKFLCFNGKPQYVILDVDRHVGHKRNIYDINWNYIDVSTDHSNFGDTVPKPDNYNEMVEIAKILAEDFPFVRVDLYLVNNKVYFGELTFYPWTGYVHFDPDEFDYVLGNQFRLPTA